MLELILIAVFVAVLFTTFGLRIIRNRDRSWERTRFWHSLDGIQSERTENWDRSQIVLGSLSIGAGIGSGIGLTVAAVFGLSGPVCFVPFILSTIAITVIVAVKAFEKVSS